MLKRVLIILHLCLAFSIFLYLMGFPFLGAHFSLRSDLLVVESALGKSALLQKIDPDKAASSEKSLSYKRAHLLEIPPAQRDAIYDAEAKIHEQMAYSAGERLRTLRFLFSQVPLSLWIWIVISVYFSVKLLKEKRLKPLSLWLLPLLVGFFWAEQAKNGAVSTLEKLIPSEEFLVREQGDGPGSSWIEKEKSKIQSAWSHFLLSHYGDSRDAPEEKKLALADMRFQMVWIQGMKTNRFIPLQERQAPATLGLFLLWNLIFAGVMSRTGQQIEKNAEKVTSGGA